MKDLFFSITNIFRWTGKILTSIRNLILNLLMLTVLAVILVALFLPSDQTGPVLEENTALILNLNGTIVEQKEEIDPFSEVINDYLGYQNPYREILLQDVLDVIASAKDDQNISIMFLDLENLGGAGLPQLATIGEAMEDFRKSGKKIIAAEDFFTQSQYYLASFADEIIINPMGGVDLHGIGVYRLYFKDILERLKINFHVFRVGSHKSALEPVMRENMSPEDRMQNKAWLDSLWSAFTDDIIEQRGLASDAIEQYTNFISANLNEYGGDTAQLALGKKLVDKIMTRVELKDYVGSLAGKNGDGDPRTIRMDSYLSLIQRSFSGAPDATESVGLIVAQGNIVPGEQPPGQIGSETLANSIQSARENSRIKALVIRIDSGGGSAFASERIRQELLAFKESGKKLVVSMGNAAASGGYWIAAPADEIWASPTTITGSIGIFGAIPTFEESLAEQGIYGDGVGTTPLSSGLNLTQPLAPEIKRTIQLSVEYGYKKFLQVVAEGRGMTIEELEEIAEGKIYDGTQAQSLGLVDQLGDLNQAISSAAGLAGLADEYDVQYIRTTRTIRERIMEQLQSVSHHLFPNKAENNMMRLFFKAVTPIMDLFSIQDPQHVYAHSMIFDTSFSSSSL